MSFKRGRSVKEALDIGQPDYFQQFWEIHNEYFYENKKDFSYPWVIPVYVYSLNNLWDGQISFDVCPVDFGKEENKNKSWKWRYSIMREEIGDKIFYTEEEAWIKWREMYKIKSDGSHIESRESIMNKRKRHMEKLKRE